MPNITQPSVVQGGQFYGSHPSNLRPAPSAQPAVPSTAPLLPSAAYQPTLALPNVGGGLQKTGSFYGR